VPTRLTTRESSSTASDGTFGLGGAGAAGWDTAARGGTLGGWADIWSRCPHPDGAGTWAQDGRQVWFLLEYDTGTENLPALTGKLDGYQPLAGAMAWNDQVCPVVLFCFTSPGREQSPRSELVATREAPRCASRQWRSTRAPSPRPGRPGCRSQPTPDTRCR
jgi:hypothetical protein